MDPLDDPFAASAPSPLLLGSDTAAILIDIHGEASSEKQAMGHILDGRVSAVLEHIHMRLQLIIMCLKEVQRISQILDTGDYDSGLG